VFSGLIGVAMAVYGSIAWPNSESGETARSFWHASRNLLHKEQMASMQKNMQKDAAPCAKLREQKPESLFFDCIRENAQANSLVTEKIHLLERKVDAENEAFFESVYEEQKNFVAKLVGIWVAFSIGIYGLGLTLGWIKKGFKNASNSN
jgi:hypothetical protein